MNLRTLRNVALTLVLAVPSLVLAQATRTWVSGVGDDANPCSRTAPCKTFAGAISKTAAGGEINVLDPGGFGAVTITKSITISSVGFEAGVLVSGTNGIVVSAAQTDVVILRGLDIEGLGTGINGVNFLNGGALYVENTTIHGFTQQGINFVPSITNGALYVRDTTIANNRAGAILIAPTGSSTAKAAIRNTKMDNNQRGLRAEDGSTVTIEDSSASGNAANGFTAFGNGARAVDMTIERSMTSMNGAGGVYSGALCTVRISNVVATGNLNGLLSAGGGAILSFGTNRVNGNTTNGAPTGSIGQM